VRLVDDLPLISSVTPPRPALAVAAAPAKPASGPVAAAAGWWQDVATRVWSEVRSLVRVTRIDQPEAMLIEPNQAFFLRENLKLRLLNARLALLSRQFDTVQSDLRNAQQSIDKYFDRNARRTALAGELLRQVAAQAQQSSVPRPDDTLGALAAVAAGR
jgi:uroporphyrin-3 C-methyltransferase